MKVTEFKWTCADRTSMFACEWQPETQGRVRAAICIVHGMGEHSGRYGHVAEMLTNEGYTVFAFDQRGHGRTEGQRGHVSSYGDLFEGVDFMLAEAQRACPDAPIFLYGHSMGGNVTLNYLLRRRPAVAGAIVTGPWLRLAFSPPLIQVILGGIMEKLHPGYSNKNSLIVENLTTDPVMAKRIIEDKLGHAEISARFFFEVRRAGLWALKHAGELQVPLLLMHGGDDKVTSIEASREFAQRAGRGCTFREWPGFRHELQNETGREDVFAVIRGWLDDQLASGMGTGI